MQHGPLPPHNNPLNHAARQVMYAAREVESPMMQKLAMGAMILSAVISTGLGVVQVVRMMRHDEERAEEKAYRKLKRELDAQARTRDQRQGMARGHGR